MYIYVLNIIILLYTFFVSADLCTCAILHVRINTYINLHIYIFIDILSVYIYIARYHFIHVITSLANLSMTLSSQNVQQALPRTNGENIQPNGQLSKTGF